jgi:hypothetical protein
MNVKVVALTAIVVTALAAPSSAHHSFAMFDEKTGQAAIWALELSSPARLKRMGMSADSVKAGDTVSVTFHPMKDGARGGQFLQAVLPGGKQVIRANAGDENAE